MAPGRTPRGVATEALRHLPGCKIGRARAGADSGWIPRQGECPRKVIQDLIFLFSDKRVVGHTGPIETLLIEQNDRLSF